MTSLWSHRPFSTALIVSCVVTQARTELRWPSRYSITILVDLELFWLRPQIPVGRNVYREDRCDQGEASGEEATDDQGGWRHRCRGGFGVDVTRDITSKERVWRERTTVLQSTVKVGLSMLYHACDVIYFKGCSLHVCLWQCRCCIFVFMFPAMTYLLYFSI